MTRLAAEKGVLMAAVDVLVLGGGSGGLAFAKRAGRLGARVVLFEPDLVGGTCVNRGCVPKKMAWYAGQLAHALRREAAGYGFFWPGGAQPMFDWGFWRQQREQALERIRHGHRRALQEAGVALVTQRAMLAGPGEVICGNGRWHAPCVVLATGGTPVVPQVPGAALGMTSDGFFQLQDQPRRVAIAGSGYIALELACALHALGSVVTLLVRSDHLLRGFEATCVRHLATILEEQGIRIVWQTPVDSLVQQADGTLVAMSSSAGHGPYDAFFWAVGRRPATAGLGLELTGVACDAAGHVITDDRQETNVPGIYALGDVTTQPALTPVAVAAGRALAERLFGDRKDRHIDLGLVPTVVFSEPPLAAVGLTEEQARARCEEVRVFESTFLPLYHTLSGVPQRTCMVLVTAGTEERVMGLHMVGRDVDEILQGFAVAIKAGITRSDLLEAIAIHPTSAEEVLTLPPRAC